jgi:2-dehydro-3-deoxy-D-arabinonate dehydratase
LGRLLEAEAESLHALLARLTTDDGSTGALLPPVEREHEIWAAGVTYQRSREARTHESEVRDVYDRVYEAERPELFFKSTGVRAVGHEMPIRIRRDARWNVPEAELTLVVNRTKEIVGYTAGNDVSSRDIEGENPLYLPQAKIYDGSCAIGPSIRLASEGDLEHIRIAVRISRAGQVVFEGETNRSRMKRRLAELVGYVGRELEFPAGVFLMTGTGIVPPDDFTLAPGDRVRIEVGELTLENEVGR